MKISICTMFALAAAFSSMKAVAADVIWSGATNSNLNTSTNWEGGVTPTGGDTIIFNGSAIVNGQVVSSTLGHVNIVVNSGTVDVKLTSDQSDYSGSITVAEGATLRNLASSTRLHASSYNIYGTYFQGWDIRLTANTTFNLGASGIIKSDSKFYSTNNTMSFTAQVETFGMSMTDSPYTLMTRNLMEISGGFNGAWGSYNWNNGNTITGSMDELLTFDSSMSSLTQGSNNLSDYEGKYYLAQSGNNLVLTYVQKNIPEPSSMMLGMLGLGGLLLRRKRS